MYRELIHSVLVAMLQIERRYEPFWRRRANALLREPLTAWLQLLINLPRRDEGLALAQEKMLPGEEAALDKIIENPGSYLQTRYLPGDYERGGNTKTHGLVRAEVNIRGDLPDNLRHGILREPRSYPAWVRFSGCSPNNPADIEDVGFLSMAVKLMGVPGAKLLDDERETQDLLASCTPTFVTPNVFASAQLRAELLRHTPLFYFLDPRRPHLLDLAMQSLWTQTQRSPLDCQYYSGAPYLLGPGRAMQYSLRPRDPARTRIANLPGRPPDHYLRENMASVLNEGDAVFDLLIQVQTDPHAMPIEHAGVRWPLRLSPFIEVATIRIPKQRFDSPAQLRFAGMLSYSAWHCVADHRPLGNQNRARLRLYNELSRLRGTRGRAPHYEPTGRETFDRDTIHLDRAQAMAARAS
jgi:hypothetical protein